MLQLRRVRLITNYINVILSSQFIFTKKQPDKQVFIVINKKT